jgi:tripartite-type tricarboxylate transporter receptor subunit TctC
LPPGQLAAGVEAVYVGYKSNPQAIPDVQGGLLDFMMIDTVNAKIAIDRGALKGLLLSDTERNPLLPDVPTAAEAGLPDVLLTTWTGYYAPKGAPRGIVEGSTPTSAPWQPSRRYWRGLTRWAARSSS